MRVLPKLVGSRSTVAAMVLASVLAMVGCGGGNSSSTSGSNGTATPTFSPGAGTYNVSQTVTIADTTQGAVLYCTTDGTTPTTSSPVCAQPTTVFKSEYLQAIAVAPGQPSSAVASAGYTIALNPAATPTFSPAGGTFTGAQSVAISDATAGVNVFYTLDGSVPTANSTLYTGPVTISQTETLSAFAVASGLADSGVNSALYTIQAVLPSPSISGIAPTSANAGGAAFTLTVNGANFVSGAAVQWNGTALTTTYVSAAQLTAAVPASLIASAGTVNVAVAQPTGISGVATFTINGVTPTITALNPSSGAAGTSVAITGSNFTGATAVNFGSTPAASFTVISPTSIAAVSPAGAGTVNVTVVTPNGSSATAAADQFTYSVPVLTGISPAAGPLAGGTSVTITGSNFTGATAVNFGSTPGTSFTVISPTSIAAVSPAGTGTVDVTVVTPNGTSATTAADQFTYSNVIPALTGISPVIGPAAGGTTVTITGSNFTGATAVNFGSTPGTNLVVSSATSLTVVSPPGTGTVEVTVVTPGGTTATVAASQFIYGATLSGTVLSGTSPIKGATVQLYAAGTTGYGTGASTLTMAPAAVTTDQSGNFSLQYGCPASGAPGDQIYLVATGGDSGSGPNSSVALMAALGTCSSAAASVMVNEVTTVASAYALSAFATVDTSGGGITVGAPALTSDTSCNAAGNWQSSGPNTCNYTGLVNAFNAVNNLVNNSTGTARTHTPAYPTDLAGDPNIVNNSTVPFTRIDALADMLASCVESNGSSCSGGLFTAAQPSGGTQPDDTLQAALDIAQNPGNNVSTLLGLVSSMTPPYSITSPDANSSPLVLSGTGAPTDLTLALTFTGAGLGIAPGVTLSDGTTAILNAGVGIDGAGNIWVAAYPYNPSNFPAGGGQTIAEFNALGAPVTQSISLSSATPPVPTYGGYSPQPGNTSGIQANLLAIDQSENLWTYASNLLGGGTTEAVVEIGTSPSLSVQNTVAKSNLGNPVAIDTNGNAWFAGENTNPNVIEVQGGSVGVTGPGLSAFNFLYSLVFDSNGGLWGVTTRGNGLDVIQIGTSDGSLVSDVFPSSTSDVAAQPTLAAGGKGDIYGCDPTGLNLDVFSVGALAHSYPLTTERACGSQLVIDGQGHIFAVLDAFFNQLGGRFFGNIDEYTTGGTLISPPANGYTGSSSTEMPALNPDSGNVTSGVFGIGAAIDGSGNLWVLNADTDGTNPSNFSILPGNVLVEYIGLGAPVVTPASTALTNDMLGSRP